MSHPSLAPTLSLILAMSMGFHSSASAAEPAAVVAASTPAFKITPADDAWRAALPRDAEFATQAYLARLPAESVAKSDAYYEGTYWLQLWDLLLGLAVATVMMSGRRAARVRDWAQSKVRKPLLRDALFAAVYTLSAWVLTLPLTIYAGFVREHAYGMATQNLAAWFGEQLVALAVNLLISTAVIGLLYALIRRAGVRWWIWGTAFGISVMIVFIALSPIYIEPLFNTYKPLEDGPIKAAVLKMAHANGVPADNVYEFNASKQTTRASANVAGLWGSAAVRLNDNLLRRASEAEIRAVMAHELGHYVLNHVVKILTALTLILLLAFYFAQWMMRWLLSRTALLTGVSRVDDVASLPLLAAVFSIFFALCTPLQNTLIRTHEAEADQFGLNLSREPHGFAEGQLKLVEYRKADPGPLEEIVFFNHPSTRKRIYAAMRWREAMGTP